ncbi:Protein CBG00581 [Caenorhabditis briggsae]|uniref:Protein CBG00581 n=2 Tax=Caenorhabditis briggsae TaxID=6238 RepID=A8WNJ2_CAEBR|nr:Protein CBG00581 [Caenorhabditis briggsae]CAP22047.2 Protein CBG00581 [Caenorhabditis briggsae]
MELAFARTDKTDGILVLLSYHSDYFNTLFSSDFREKSMPKIEIKDVKFEDFATLLSLVQKDPIEPTEDTAESILELAERFMLSAAKRHVELVLLSSEMGNLEKIELPDKHDLNFLLVETLKKCEEEDIEPTYEFSEFSDKTKARILDRLIEL